MNAPATNAETVRLREDQQREKNWKRWGPYLSERQWGTVREDYSPDGESWDYFTHEHARSRAYRWGEDGLLGITDRECRLCFGLALWNGKDPILKERLFGLSGPEGNHGEDVKEYYFYLDSTPTHSYMKALYKYPQAEFPYEDLVTQNRERSRDELEYELADTGVFDDRRYFDITAEYAKASPNDVLIRITIINRGPEPANLDVLPTLWFRNTWSWGCEHEGCWPKPRIWDDGDPFLHVGHVTLPKFHFHAAATPDGRAPKWLFTENETNDARLADRTQSDARRKDAFHDYIVDGRTDVLNPRSWGTKAAPHYALEVSANSEVVLNLRLSAEDEGPHDDILGESFDEVFRQRIQEADEFFEARAPDGMDEDRKNVMRQANAGLLWTKQFYHYVVADWLEGDPEMPPVAESRKQGRNADWLHVFNRDVLSMPDKWEYPWFAAWDSAFHMVPFAALDSHFAKDQLLLFLREWYMHPNGQIPAYEWALGDVNPPVHAWACWRVYEMSGSPGQRDREFLARAFQKLLLNFTWWVNRKDVRGKQVFAGGFLGLDNIGIFDRSKPLPTGGFLEQADGTAWMAFFCGTMLAIAFELAAENPAYEDMASKFFEHYIAIAHAMNTIDGTGLWDEEDGFYYDHLHMDGQLAIPLRIRSMVGLIPLFTAGVLRDEVIERLPGFRKRMQWFLENRPEFAKHMSFLERDCPDGVGGTRRLLAIPSQARFERILGFLLDESEFLSPFGIRSLSKYHLDNPFVFRVGNDEHSVAYVPGESDSWMFGGNSNWRGPVWFPVNYLLIGALRRYHEFYGDTFKVECPTGSGHKMTLCQVADEIERRLISIFLKDNDGRRPCHGADERWATDPYWRNLPLFYEYFHGDNGRGLGASHQTGWTALVATILSRAK